jgi:rubredoxin
MKIKCKVCGHINDQDYPLHPALAGYGDDNWVCDVCKEDDPDLCEEEDESIE